MIDYFALGLTHALIMIALARVLVRPDLDREDPLAEEPEEVIEPRRRGGSRATRRRKGRADA